MIKREISKELSKRTGLTPAQSLHAVDGVINIIRDAILIEEPIYLRGFATIKVVESAAKVARLINKNKSIKIPKGKRVKVIISDQLKEQIKNLNK